VTWKRPDEIGLYVILRLGFNELVYKIAPNPGYDEKDSLYVTDAMYVFSLKEGIDPLAAMAVLQSKLFLFLYRVTNQGESRVIPQVKAAKLIGIPFPDLLASDHSNTLSELSKTMCLLNEQLASEKSDHARTELERRISSTDRDIDELVYKIYGISCVCQLDLAPFDNLIWPHPNLSC
jgi:hypothetical protein